MYGLVYLLGFLAAAFLGRKRFPCYENTPLYTLYIAVLAALGAIIGGRLGYALFYEPGHYLDNPAEIPLLYLGGMSFHGGLLGLLFAVLLADIRGFWTNLDRMAFLACLILPLGRIANFLNGELWGTPCAYSWCVIFEAAGDGLPRHPVQLYEAVLEGPALLVLILAFRHFLKEWARVPGVTAALFGIGYALLRFGAEFFREPDPVTGYLWRGFTRGQGLCAIMLLAGFAMLLLRLRARRDSIPEAGRGDMN